MAKSKFHKYNSKRAYKTYFYISDALLVILGIGFILCAFFTDRSEKERLQVFEIQETEEIVLVFYITGAFSILASAIGSAAKYKGSGCFWILYCILLAAMFLVEISVGGSAIGNSVNNIKRVREKLKLNVLDQYVRDPNFHRNNLSSSLLSTEGKAWDDIQIELKCCGLDNYTDWQDVQFGRTSLLVPRSCCLKKHRDNENGNESKYCGRNCLPETQNASDFIHPEGCLPKIMKNINKNLDIMGIYGIVVSIFQLILMTSATYLLISKKM